MRRRRGPGALSHPGWGRTRRPPESAQGVHLVVTRFAPSPTGLLHLGHARAAIVAHDAARAAGGRFLLRIEDIDPGRCRPEYVDAIREDLAWLGLRWDDERVQSADWSRYAATLGALRDRALVYGCACTRRDIAEAGGAPHVAPDGGAVYPGTCRGRDVTPLAWRLDMARALRVTGPLSFTEHGVRRACDPAAFGDVVLARRGTPASYMLCATQDDAADGVTLVTRGDDLLPATAVQRVLQALMGWPEPVYAHHALALGADGRRLAKRDAAKTLRSLRKAQCSPAEARAMALDCFSL